MFDAGGLCGQCEASGTLTSEEAKASFVLPLWEVVVHSARWERKIHVDKDRQL
jgi:hypothetical protein